MITGLHAIEGLPAIGDEAHEHIDAAGGAFWVRGAGHTRGEIGMFEQRHDIDAVGFQHRALRQVDFVHEDRLQLVDDGGVGAGQETGAHAIGHRAEAQIDAGGLDLPVLEIFGRANLTVGADQALQHVAG